MSRVLGGSTDAGGTVVLHLPLVSGDPEGVHRLAATYLGLAESIEVEVRRAATALEDLRWQWLGRAATSALSPVEQLEVNAATVTSRLRRCAAEFEALAGELERAHEHHGWSIGRLLALGAIVAVTATAVVVTMGAATAAAGAADAALVADAADGAETAAAAAATAGDGTAAALGGDASGLAEIRAFGAFVLPHLAAGEMDAGATAFLHELSSGRINWASVAGAGAAGLGGSAVAEDLGITTGPMLSGAPALVRRAAPHLIEAGVWGAAGAGQDVLDGSPIRVDDILVSAVTGGATSVGRETHAAWLTARAAAAATPAAQARRISVALLAGRPDLDAHEILGGHALARHVTLAQPLDSRLAGPGRVRFASAFHSRAVADRAIGQVLLDNSAAIERWLAGSGDRLAVTGRFRDGSAGVVRYRGSPTATIVERVTVILDRPGGVPRIVTAYPVFTKPPRIRRR